MTQSLSRKSPNDVPVNRCKDGRQGGHGSTANFPENSKRGNLGNTCDDDYSSLLRPSLAVRSAIASRKNQIRCYRSTIPLGPALAKLYYPVDGDEICDEAGATTTSVPGAPSRRPRQGTTRPPSTPMNRWSVVSVGVTQDESMFF